MERMLAADIKFDTPYGEIRLVRHTLDEDNKSIAIAKFEGRLTIEETLLVVRFRCSSNDGNPWQTRTFDEKKDPRSIVILEVAEDTPPFADPTRVKSPKTLLEEAFNAIKKYLTEALSKPEGLAWMMEEQRMWNRPYPTLENE